MQINSSISSSYMNMKEKNIQSSLNKISSGKNQQLDDATLALISDSLGNNIGALSQGLANANDATSMIQIASGVLQNVSQNTQDLNNLSVKANSAALSNDQKAMLNTQADAIKSTMQQSLNGATYNGQQLFGQNLNFSLGNSTISASLPSLDTSSLDINTQSSITDFMKSVQNAQSQVGSASNALSSSTDSLLTQINSLSSAKSQVSDSDIAQQLNNFSQNNLMLNASLITQAHRSSINSAMVSQLLG